jgi:hypothetical protein
MSNRAEWQNACHKYIVRESGRKLSSTFMHNTNKCPDRLKKTTNDTVKNNQSLDRFSNLVPPEYEAGVLDFN